MNKMFKKLLAVAAVVATAACLSVPAFAADYTPADGAITVTPATTPTDASMYTVMLFKTTVDVTDEDAVKAATPAVADIYYINQDTVLSNLVNGMLVKATTVDETTTYLPEGNYIARIGNDKGSVENLIVTVAEKTVSVVYGDLNLDGVIDASDSLILDRHVLEWDDYTKEKIANFAGADLNGDGVVDASDSLILDRHVLEWDDYQALPIIPVEN